MRHRERYSELKTVRGCGVMINHYEQTKISPKHINAGDVSNKIPIPLSDGKTIVFAKSKEDVERVRKFWENRIKQNFKEEL